MEWGLGVPSGQGEACDIKGGWLALITSLLLSLPRVSPAPMVQLAKRYSWLSWAGPVPVGMLLLAPAFPWPLCAFSNRSSCKCSLDRCAGSVPLLLWGEEWGTR